MRQLPIWFSLSPLCLAAALGAEPALPHPAMEKRLLCGPESAAQWGAAESTVASSTAHTQVSPAALHWHVTVDYFAGEAKYPIGWPRANWTFRDPAARDWSDWDFLQLRVYTDTTRETLPAEPVGLALHAPDKANAFARPLTELKKGQWVEIRIPLAQIPQRRDVRTMQFHIAESKYRHQDQLDLYFDEIALLRYAEPTLDDFAAESTVMFADVKYIPVQFQLLGVKPQAAVEIACTLRREGQVTAQTQVVGARGFQRVVLDVSRQPLAAGLYELTAQVAGTQRPARAQVRLVESPWK